MMESTSEVSQSLALTPKKRSQADKKGRINYTFELLHRILDELEFIRIAQRHIITGLELAELMHFDQPYIEKVCSRDELDKTILRVLYESGHKGILPKDLVLQVKDPKLWDRWQVLHRIEHMNRRLNEEIGQQVAEKRGHEWTLTDFTYQAYKLTEQEIKAGQVTTNTPDLEGESDESFEERC